jgi:hypothetical protein
MNTPCVVVLALATLATLVAAAGTGADGSWSPCKTCVYLVDSVSRSKTKLLTTPCNEIFANTSDARTYGLCHQAVDALKNNRASFRLEQALAFVFSIVMRRRRDMYFRGCLNPFNQQWERPCPAWAICSMLKDFRKQRFCTPSDYATINS